MAALHALKVAGALITGPRHRLIPPTLLVAYRIDRRYGTILLAGLVTNRRVQEAGLDRRRFSTDPPVKQAADAAGEFGAAVRLRQQLDPLSQQLVDARAVLRIT